MTDELYIDGQKVDMASDSGIYLTYRSNIFSDISKIVGDNSGTIKLPNTSRNKAIIDGCSMVSNNSAFPYKTHAGTLVRDGVPIITGATVVLLSVSESTIEVSLAWGASAELKEFVNDGGNVNELNFLTDHIWEDNNALYPIAIYCEGSGNVTDNGTKRFPFISVKDMLSQIASENGIAFEYSGDRLNDWVVPLLSAKDGWSHPVTFEIYNSDTNNWWWAVLATYCYPYLYQVPDNLNTGSRDKNLVPYYARYCNGYPAPYYDDSGTTLKSAKEAMGETAAEGDDLKYRLIIQPATGKWCKMKISGDFIYYAWKESETEALKTAFRITNNYYATDDAEEITSVEVFSVYPQTATQIKQAEGGTLFLYELHYTFTDEETDEIYGGNKYFKYGLRPSIDTDNVVYLSGTREVAGTITVSFCDEEIKLGEEFIYKFNLPDIDQIKFVKGVMQMAGLFAFLKEDGKTVKFVEYEDLYDNKSKAYDWTDKLVDGVRGISSNGEFTQGDEAQHNYCTFGDSDDYPSFNGDYIVENETLDYERDAIELPFKAYDLQKGSDLLKIIIWEYSDGSYTFKENTKAHIARLAQIDDKYYLKGDTVRWPQLLEANYKEYVEMLNNCKKLTETFVLKSTDLLGIDLSVPVYLKQYGAYFGIVSIKTKSNYKADVELIKL